MGSLDTRGSRNIVRVWVCTNAPTITRSHARTCPRKPRVPLCLCDWRQFCDALSVENNRDLIIIKFTPFPPLLPVYFFAETFPLRARVWTFRPVLVHGALFHIQLYGNHKVGQNGYLKSPLLVGLYKSTFCNSRVALSGGRREDDMGTSFRRVKLRRGMLGKLTTLSPVHKAPWGNMEKNSGSRLKKYNKSWHSAWDQSTLNPGIANIKIA